MNLYQLDTIKSAVRKFEEGTKGVIRLGLLFITSNSNIDIDDFAIKQFRKDVFKIMHRLKTEIINKKKISKTESNISACWLIPKSIALNDNAPGIILIGKFYKPIIHKGAKLRDANLDI